MKFVIFLFSALTLCWSSRSAAEDPEWLVKVSSIFSDELTHEPITFVGSGSIVKINETCLVLTASHVATGENLKIQNAEKNLSFKPERQVINVDDDIALIELESCSQKPLATWTPNYDWRTHLGFFVIPTAITKIWMEKCSFWCSQIPNLLQVSGGGALVPKGSWVTLPTEDWRMLPELLPRKYSKNEYFRRYGNMYGSYDNTEIYSEGRIVPGMSGSPLILGTAKIGGHLYTQASEITQDSVWGLGYDPTAVVGLLAGVTKRYVRSYDRSFFASSQTIDNLVRRYQVENFGPQSKSQWKLRKGLQYLEDEAGISEVNLISTKTGNGISGGGGNGISGGGGNGVSGGGGLTTNVNGLTNTALRYLWENWGIINGLGEKNGPGIVAYHLFYQNSKTSFYIEANWNSKLMLPTTDKDVIISKVSTKDSLLPLFESRAETTAEANRNSKASDYECLVRVDRSGPAPHIQIHILIPGLKKNEVTDHIFLSLDEYGCLANSQESFFLPMRDDVIGSSGASYTVDLRGLFYTDISMISKESAWGQGQYSHGKPEANFFQTSVVVKRSGYMDGKFLCNPSDNPEHSY